MWLWRVMMVVMNLKSCQLVQPLVLVVLVIVKATIGLLLLPLVNPTFVNLMMSSCRSCNETTIFSLLLSSFLTGR
ncbi:hypothetical protein OIU79_022236 [Salix purpurea]|uniref:Uncharacterized protein n=1 Tax=Salix purpurea TaxID=77065 RepID=A0A9Q0WFH5_SALPP|nr:hypothetical protein OIU79_022236 [Salix purpurea]